MTHFPHHMTLVLTAKCNFRCPYCYCVWHERPELKWSIAVSITVTRANMSEAADIFAAAALSGAKSIQLGPMMAGGRARTRPDLMVTRAEWKSVKERIRSLPDGRVPYTFCDEFICECRADLPDALREKWRDPNHKPCPAGRDFGTIGPNGRYRPCLHAL